MMKKFTQSSASSALKPNKVGRLAGGRHGLLRADDSGVLHVLHKSGISSRSRAPLRWRSRRGSARSHHHRHTTGTSASARRNSRALQNGHARVVAPRPLLRALPQKRHLMASSCDHLHADTVHISAGADATNTSACRRARSVSGKSRSDAPFSLTMAEPIMRGD